MNQDITEMTAAELSRALHRRELSSSDAAAAYLGRMTQAESTVHAYITPTARRALEGASAADEMLKNGDASALCGIPYAAKDNLAVEGVRMTCASKMLADFVPDYTAAVVERADSAGCVLLGKTNMDEFAMGSSTERSIAGPTHNPLDPACSAGGSSGGSAAAVAAREAVWAIGSDTGGSARQPASFCGLVSLKPTYGLVSRRGMTELASSLDCVCPITRDVTDCALAMNLLAGRDPGDMTTFDSHEDYMLALDGGVSGMTFGIPRPEMLDECEPSVRRAMNRAARILETLGARVTEVDLPLEMALEIYMVVAAAEASSNLARFDGLRYGLTAEGATAADRMRATRSAGFGDEVKRRILTGAYALSSTYGGGYYRKIKAAQATVCRETDTALDTVDAVLLPTASGVAFRLGSYADNPTALYRSDCFTTVANLTGIPALQIPGGGDGHLPVGLSLMGKKRAEKTLFRAAFALESELKPFVGKEVGRDAVGYAKPC